MTAERVRTWRQGMETLADQGLSDDLLTANQARLDQLVAAAREAGLTDRETGVLAMGVIERHIRTQQWARRLTADQITGMAAAFTIRLMSN